MGKFVAWRVEGFRCHSAPGEEEVVPGGAVGAVRDNHSCVVEGRRGMQAVAKACHSLSGQLEGAHYEANEVRNHQGAGHIQNAILGHVEVELEEAGPARLEGVELDEHGEKGPQSAD